MAPYKLSYYYYYYSSEVYGPNCIKYGLEHEQSLVEPTHNLVPIYRFVSKQGRLKGEWRQKSMSNFKLFDPL